MKLLSLVRLFATPWTVAHQAPLSMGFSRQEYWSGLPFPSPGDLPNPGMEPRSPALRADALTSEPPGKPILDYSQLINSVVIVSVDSKTTQPHTHIYIYIYVSILLQTPLPSTLPHKIEQTLCFTVGPC